jgi:homoserine O-acetyltransferase
MRAFFWKVFRMSRLVALAALVFFVAISGNPQGTPPAAQAAAAGPAPTDGDFAVKDFRFGSGEVLPQMNLHYATLGTPQRDAGGRVTNAVLILHGTGGSGRQFLQPQFAGELFGQGGLLDATRYFIILPDNVGHGRSSKPSDGLRAKFPTTITTTWSARSICSSPQASASIISAW